MPVAIRIDASCLVKGPQMRPFSGVLSSLAGAAAGATAIAGAAAAAGAAGGAAAAAGAGSGGSRGLGDGGGAGAGHGISPWGVDGGRGVPLP